MSHYIYNVSGDEELLISVLFDVYVTALLPSGWSELKAFRNLTK